MKRRKGHCPSNNKPPNFESFESKNNRFNKMTLTFCTEKKNSRTDPNFQKLFTKMVRLQKEKMGLNNEWQPSRLQKNSSDSVQRIAV